MTALDISSVTERYTQLNADFEAYVAKAGKELRAEIRKTLDEVLKLFFEANPHVASISWRQYTPYFNDGDACQFSVGDPILTLRSDYSRDPDYDYGEEEEDGEDDWGDWDEDDDGEFRDESSLLSDHAFYSSGRYKDPKKVAEIEARLALVGGDEAFAKIKADFDVVSKFVSSIDEDHLEEMIGDHVLVRCSRDGIEVFEYTDHD
jgi:hypothetical protein